jgi:uncharacterized phage-associated protein
LITDKIKAWKFGPVIDSVYHEFKNFGSRDITNHGTAFINPKGTTASSEINSFYGIPCIDNKGILGLVNRIWEVYGAMDAIELSGLTHAPGSPWFESISEHQEGKITNYILPNQFIGECMAKQLETEAE